jgi:hypothetical protein
MMLTSTEPAKAMLYTMVQFRRSLAAAWVLLRRCLGSAMGARAPPLVRWRMAPPGVARHTVGVLPLMQGVSSEGVFVGKRKGLAMW